MERKWVYGCLGVVAIGLFGAVGVYASTGRRAADLAWDELASDALSDNELQVLLDGRAALAEVLPFGEVGPCEADAGPLLNPLLAADVEGYPAESPPWWAEVDKRTLRDWDTAPEGVPTGDVSVLAQLRQKECWDFTEGGAYGRYLAEDPPSGAATRALPNLVPLQSLAKIRLAQGLRGEVDMLEALAEVRQLAVLAHDVDHLIGSMVGLAILIGERKGYEAAVARGLVTSEDWTPLSEQDRLLAKKVGFGMAAVAAGLGPRNGLSRMLDQDDDGFGVCAALAEGMLTLAALRPYLEDPGIGEIDQSWRITELEAAIARTDCELGWVQPIWDTPSRSGPMLLDAAGTPDSLTVVLLNRRWWRQVVVARVLEDQGLLGTFRRPESGPKPPPDAEASGE